MATKMKKDCIYRNKHNHRVVQCVGIEMSDYGIATYQLQDIEPDENGYRRSVYMTDLDVEHWTQIAGRTKIHKVPARQEGYAYRTRVRKGDEEE
tara:strand:- start:4317 stop:4598 length:282 start_codon:yes stop_codon:yes gene_type:complete